MHTLTEITPVFAALDRVPEEGIPQYEKALRNLLQRHHLPPSDQRGRVFLYDHGAISAIRLVQIANTFGLDRLAIDPLARWLHASGERKRRVEGGWFGVSHCEEAVERSQAGEDFSISLICRSDYRFDVEADWHPGEPPSERVRQALESAGLSRQAPPEIARFMLPAASLIRAVIGALKE